jgi:YrbI family 3-deoxy-D-manno-octulosonate 8-phosphate phosphatase
MIKKNSSLLIKKCTKIKLVITDVDGVLTDGSMYYSKHGEELKKFNTKDGMGVELLLKVGIKTIFLTKEKSIIAQKRGKKVKAAFVFTGIENKESMLPIIRKKFNVSNEEIAYIGDDVNDLEIIKNIGFSGCPIDAIEQIKKKVDYITKKSGGSGSFREFTDLIIRFK